MADYMNATGAAAALQVTPPTVLAWLEKGLFPNAYQVQGTIRIPLKDIAALKRPKKKRTPPLIAVALLFIAIAVLGWVGKLDAEARQVGQVTHYDADINF